MSKKRYDYIDIAKGICILLIVLFHIDFSFWTDNSFGVYITRFASFFKVTLFFCLSGLTLKEEKLAKTKSFIIDKIKKLYLKVAIIGIIFVLLHNVFIQIGFYTNGVTYSGKLMHSYSLLETCKECGLSLLMANREVMIGPLWFGNVLFIALMIEVILCAVIKKLKIPHAREVRLAVCFLLMVIGWVLGEFFALNIPRANNSLSALFLIDFTQYLKSVRKIKFDNVIMFIITSVVCLISPVFGSFSMNKNVIINPLIFIAVTIAFMYSFLFLSQKIELIPHRILKFIGLHSFDIMVYQFLGFKVAALIVGANTGFLMPTADNVWWMLYYLAFGILIPIIIGCLIDLVKKGCRTVLAQKNH